MFQCTACSCGPIRSSGSVFWCDCILEAALCAATNLRAPENDSTTPAAVEIRITFRIDRTVLSCQYAGCGRNIAGLRGQKVVGSALRLKMLSSQANATRLFRRQENTVFHRASSSGQARSLAEISRCMLRTLTTHQQSNMEVLTKIPGRHIWIFRGRLSGNEIEVHLA